MIAIILFIYIGVQISAPGWYYTLLGVVALLKLLNFGIKVGKKAAE